MKFKTQFKKRIIKIGSTILLIIAIGTSIITYKINQENKELISVVQCGVSKINEQATYKTAFEKYFQNTSWSTYKTSEDIKVVGFIGYKHDKERDVMIKYDLQYTVDQEQNTFKLYKAYANDMPLNQIEVLAITIQAMSSFDSVDNF